MNAEEFASYDGLGLAALVRKGAVSAAELLDLAVARVEAKNGEINAVVTRLYDQARAAIAAGLPAGPFTGVPYLLKDLGAHYEGAVTSFGSALFKEPAPERHSPGAGAPGFSAATWRASFRPSTCDARSCPPRWSRPPACPPR